MDGGAKTKTKKTSKKAAVAKKVPATKKKVSAAKKTVVAKAPSKKVVVEAKGPPNFYTYIAKISKEVNDGVGVRKNVREFLDTVLKTLITELTQRATQNLKKRTTLQERDIEAAVNAYLPENKVREMVLKEASNVLKEFGESGKVELLMSVPRTKKNMTEGLGDNIKISRKATIYLAAALEQVVIELTEAANVYSKQKERSNITLPDLQRAIKKDADLKEFMARADPAAVRVEATVGSGDEESGTNSE